MNRQSCANCEAGFFEVGEVTPQLTCLFCGESAFANAFSDDQLKMAQMPYELIIPFSIDIQVVEEKLTRFISLNRWKGSFDVRFGVGKRRLRPYYIPVWLSDIPVKAKWKGEFAFEKANISAIDKRSYDGWKGEEIEQTSWDWQPLAGKYEENLNNQTSLAIQNKDIEWLDDIVAFDMEEAIPFDEFAINDAIICVPHGLTRANRVEFNNKTILKMQNQVVTAVEAETVRNFEWESQAGKRNFTQLLIPAYVTYFYDEKKVRHMVVINGRTGLLTGKVVISKWSSIWPSLLLLFIGFNALTFMRNNFENTFNNLPLLVLNMFVLIFLIFAPILRLFLNLGTISNHDPGPYRF